MITQPKVFIAGPDHVLNESGAGYIIYAEWHIAPNAKGCLESHSQILDGAITPAEAERKRNAWADGIS